MLAPMARMRAILQKNNLSKGWSPDTAKTLLKEVQDKAADIGQQFSTLELIRATRQGDPVPGMQQLQDDIGSALVALLMVASQAGLDSALLFTMATTAEAEGRDETAAYAGIARAALVAAWGEEYSALLGLPAPRKE